MTDARHCLHCGAALASRETADGARLACPDPRCGFVFYDNPTPVVAAIVEHEGGVLLVAQHDWPETWFGLVTGFLERGETPEEGVLREVKEELGLRGEVASLVGVYAFQQRNELIVAYHVRAEGEVTLGEELRGFKRVPIEKLRPWDFGTGHAVRDWLARRP
jgi:NADH pyrophosphatase NudC (nudix superfamily)